MRQVNGNDVSIDGRLCNCGRRTYDKHAETCPARKQCETCSRNIFEPHEPGCRTRTVQR